MRKTNWLFLLSLASGVVTLAAVLAVWVSLRHRPPEPLVLPKHADATTYGSMALELAGQSRYGDALTANTRALSYSPEHVELLYNQAWLEARLGRWGQALNQLERARKQAPNDPAIAYTRAWLLQQLGRVSEARSELAQARKLGDQPSDPYVQARLYQLENRHAQALQAFAKAVQAQPEQPPAFYYWRSRSQRELGHSKEALADLDRAVTGNVTPRLYRERATVHEQLGQLPEALADLARSRALEPSKEADLAHARLQLTVDPVAAQTEIAALLKADPKWVPAKLLQVRAMMNARQLKPAQQSLAEIQVQDPQNPEAWWLQGMLSRIQRKYPQSLSALNQAQKLGYDSAKVELELTRLAAQQGQRDEVRQRVTKLLKSHPELKAELESDRLLKKYLKPARPL